MNFLLIFLQDAVLNEPAAKTGMGGGMGQMLIFMVLIFAVMYLLMIRPQQKKQKEQNNFRNSLQPGQKVITAGGIYGKIKEVKETYVLLEVDNNAHIRVDKSMIMKDPTDLPQDGK